MGCGESKIKRINLTPESQGSTGSTLDTISSSIATNEKEELGLDDSSNHPNRLLAAIPISDLGESLDSRHLNLNGSLNLSHNHCSKNGLGGLQDRHSPTSKSVPNSADSGDSGDSGYDEYEEDYGHIITEHSASEVVQKVVNEFQPVDLPELLVITGRACARILSGYQKGKIHEAKILDTLREEGLLAKPRGKTAGGLSFEVIDKSVENNEFDPSAFMPSRTLARLESRRENIRKPVVQIDDKLTEAEERRKMFEEEKVEKCREVSGVERHGRMRSASALRRDVKYSATLAKRQQQLQEMRDKLKEKHKKNEMVRLKKNLMDPNSGTNSLSGSLNKKSSFFDD